MTRRTRRSLESPRSRSASPAAATPLMANGPHLTSTAWTSHAAAPRDTSSTKAIDQARSDVVIPTALRERPALASPAMMPPVAEKSCVRDVHANP